MEEKKTGGYLGTVTVGEKGQIVIPKAVRTMLGIEPGDELMILARADMGIGIPPKERADAIRGEVLENERKERGHAGN